MRIGVDIDGVLYDFVSAFRELAIQTFGRQIPSFSLDWDFGNWGLTPEEYKHLWSLVRNSEDWFLVNQKPYPFSAESLGRLKDHELSFITTRGSTKGKTVLYQAQMQLSRLGIEFPTVVVRSDKGPVVRGLGLDFYVDDYVENLKTVEQCSPSTTLFLVNHTYNKDINVPPTWTRVDSFKVFSERIETAYAAN